LMAYVLYLNLLILNVFVKHSTNVSKHVLTCIILFPVENAAGVGEIIRHFGQTLS